MSLVTLIIMASVMLTAQHGTVNDNLTMNSDILKMERNYAIYLPPDYETSQRSYPVLYLLHGAGTTRPGGCNSGRYFAKPMRAFTQAPLRQ